MRYQEFPPSPALAAHVRCVRSFDAEAAQRAPVQHIVPDGRCELVFHVAHPFTEADGAAKPERVQPLALFAGQLSRPLFVGCTPAQFLSREYGIGVAIVQAPAIANS